MAIPSGAPRIDVRHAASSYATQVTGDPSVNTYPQCTFLDSTGDLFVKQLAQQGSNNGDLVIARLTPASGGGWTFADSMTLRRFGHGGSFSVNRTPPPARISCGLNPPTPTPTATARRSAT